MTPSLSAVKNLFLLFVFLLFAGSACKDDSSPTNSPEKKENEKEVTIQPKQEIKKDFSREIYRGTATFFEGEFKGRKGKTEEIFDKNQFTAAVRTTAIPIPMGTIVEVFNQKNNKKVRVKVKYKLNKRSVNIISLSYQAAEALGMADSGEALVMVQAVKGNETGVVEK